MNSSPRGLSKIPIMMCVLSIFLHLASSDDMNGQQHELTGDGADFVEQVFKPLGDISDTLYRVFVQLNYYVPIAVIIIAIGVLIGCVLFPFM